MQASIGGVTAQDAMRTSSFTPIGNASIGGVTANMLFRPSSTENKIKQIAQSTTTQPKKLTQQDLFGDTKKIQEAKGISSEEALLNTMKYYQEKGLQVEGIDLDAEIQALSPQEVVEEDKNKTIRERIGGISQNIEQKQAEIESSDRSSFRKKLDRLALGAETFSDLVFNTLGEGIETSGQVLSAITPNSIEDKVKNNVEKAFNFAMESQPIEDISAALGQTGKAAKFVYEKLPEDIQKDVESLGTIGLGILDAVGVGATKNLAKQGITKTKELASNKTFLTQAKRDAYIEKAAKELDTEVLQLSQTKNAKKDIPKFTEAIKKIDTNDIETYEDLTNRFSDKISVIGKKQDELLPTERIYSIDDLSTTVGNRKTNFVKEALDDLEDVGLKENDLELLAKVDELSALEKLSEKDINDLARFYGGKFKEKSFNKMGDPKSSISAARFENNRSGLKDLVRSYLPDDTAKALDAEMSNLYTAKTLSEQMEAQVSNVLRRVRKRSIKQKLTRTAADIIDFISLGTARDFAQGLMRKGMGNNLTDALTLQSELKSSLKEISKLVNKIEKAEDATIISNALEDFAKSIGITREMINEQALKGKEALGDAFDKAADATGARSKLMSGEGTGISGKIDNISKVAPGMLEATKKYKTLDEFYKNRFNIKGEPGQLDKLQELVGSLDDISEKEFMKRIWNGIKGKSDDYTKSKTDILLEQKGEISIEDLDF